MSFATDFTAIAGSITSDFTAAWKAVNTPSTVATPAVQPSSPQGSGGAGSVLPRNTSTGTTSGFSLSTVLLISAGIILVVVAGLLHFGKGRR